MAAITGDAAGSAAARAGQRWRAIDPLLPAPAPLPDGCGWQSTAAPGSAAASCDHWAGEPGAIDLTWGAARRFRLTARLAGPDIGQALAAVLPQWRDHLREVPGTGAGDTAAVVLWPSRDVAGVATLYRHGLAPRGVIAARVMRQPAAAPAAPPPGITIRRAAPADLAAVVHLAMETVRYDAHFGGVIERPWTEDALRGDLAGLLAAPQPWIWLAERGGVPVGQVIAEPPAAAAWIAPMTVLAPVAYLYLMAVLPAERARGIGAALVAHLHRDITAAGVAVTLLHHEQTNPLSAPFWAQQGYRPLWTSWEARPAATLR